MARSITFIPARAESNGVEETQTPIIKKKVAAYCRVSTDQEEQLSSYEAQVRYYTDYIENNPLYENAGIYADEGITGTNTKKRDQFNKMIVACEAGEIDLIITKSISRFARNTLDCLNYVRHLKSLGIGIIFEKENIDTLDAKGEVLLTILSSLAQEESRSISENSTWGIRRRFEQGKVTINEKKFLSYDKDEEGNLIINDKQAQVVRYIYKEYLDGKGPNRIAKELEQAKVKGPTGATKWYQSTIMSILQNEKYKGEALLQKSYTKDSLNKTRVENNGEVRQYYVHESHPAIIEPETWEAVGLEIQRRKKFCEEHEVVKLDYASSGHAFCGRIICAKCNHAYGRKTWMSTEEKYKKITWVCNNKCGGKHIDDKVLKEVAVTSFNTILDNKDYFLQKWQQQLEQGDLLKQYRLKELMGIVDNGQKLEEFDSRWE
ncbi:MAG: recombinase family protein [Cellulosilyticaceae bacterium]